MTADSPGSIHKNDRWQGEKFDQKQLVQGVGIWLEKNWIFNVFGRYRAIWDVLANVFLEPKVCIFSIWLQKPSCRAQEICQLCQRDECFICFCLKVMNRARMQHADILVVDMRVFLYFQHVWPHLVHVSWWSTRPWTARTTWRKRPRRSLILGCITSVRIFFN